jgi:RNA polymerase primary sigma factor
MQQRDAVGDYLNAIGRIPLLTAAEEIHQGQMVRAWLDHPDGPDAAPSAVRRRGLRARDRMVQANLRLVVAIAKKNSNRGAQVGLGLLDLIQEGSIGLVRGVEKFAPAMGYKFSTYAYWWVRQGVGRAIEAAGTIRIPVHVSQKHYRLQRVAADLGEGACFEEVAEAAGMGADEAAEVLAGVSRARGLISLDAQVGRGKDDSDGSSLLECLAGPQQDALLQTDLAAAVENLRDLGGDDLALLELSELERVKQRDLASLLEVSRSGASEKLRQARQRLAALAGEETRELLAA